MSLQGGHYPIIYPLQVQNPAIILRKISESGNDKPIYILTMTDYDPAGYYIADTFKTQAEDLLFSMGMDKRVRIQRIGITPDQLTHEEVRQNWYTPKKGKPIGLDESNRRD